VKKAIVLVLFMVFSAFAITLSGQSKVAYLDAAPAHSTFFSGNKSTVTFPYKVVGGHFFVEADLGQDRGLFILDTGAPSLVINQQQVNKELDAAGVNADVPAEATIVQHFRWRNEEWKNLSAIAMNLEHLEKCNKERILGLIGFDLLQRSELIFDTKNREIHVTPGTEDASLYNLKPRISFPINMQEHLPVVELKIGKQSFRFAIDTGAESNLLNKKSADRLETALVQQQGINRIIGIEGQIRTCPIIQVSGVELADKVKFTVMDLSHLDQFSGTRIDGLIGGDLLRRFSFSINYRKQALNIWDLH
jgi:predicted aspartyl protease